MQLLRLISFIIFVLPASVRESEEPLPITTTEGIDVTRYRTQADFYVLEELRYAKHMPKTFKHGRALQADQVSTDVTDETQVLPSEVPLDLGELEEERVEERENAQVRDSSMMVEGLNIIADDEHWMVSEEDTFVTSSDTFVVNEESTEKNQVAVKIESVTQGIPGRESPNEMGERADSFETEHFSALIIEESETEEKADIDVSESTLKDSSDDKNKIVIESTQTIVSGAPLESTQMFTKLREEIITLAPARSAPSLCFSDATLKLLFNTEDEKRNKISGNDFSEIELHSLLTFLSNEKPEGFFYSKFILDFLQGNEKPILEARAFDSDKSWNQASDSVDAGAKEIATTFQVNELSTVVADECTIDLGQMSRPQDLVEVRAEKARPTKPENIEKQKAKTQAVAAFEETTSDEATHFTSRCLLGNHKLSAADYDKLMTQPVMCDKCSKDNILKLVEVGRTLDAMGVSLQAIRIGAPVQNDTMGSVVWNASEERKTETLTQIAEASKAIKSILSRALLIATALETEKVDNQKWLRVRELVRPMVVKQAIEIQQMFENCQSDLRELKNPTFTGLALVEEKFSSWIRLREKVDRKIDSITAQFTEAPKSQWDFQLSDENFEDKSDLLEFLIDYGFQQWMSPKSVTENQSFDFFVKEKVDVQTRRCRNAIVEEVKAKDLARMCPNLEQTKGGVFGESGFADITASEVTAASNQSEQKWTEGILTNEITEVVGMGIFEAPESRYTPEEKTEQGPVGTKCSPHVFKQPWPKAEAQKDTKIQLVPITQCTLKDEATSQMQSINAAGDFRDISQSSAENLDIPKDSCESSQCKGVDNKMGESGVPWSLGVSSEVDMDWARPREEFGTLPDVLPSNAFSEKSNDDKYTAVRIGQAPLMDELSWLRSREADSSGRVPNEVPGEQSSFENRQPQVNPKPKIKGRSLEEEFSWMRPRENFDDFVEAAEDDVTPVTINYEEYEQTPKELIWGVSKEEEYEQIILRLREKIGIVFPKLPSADACDSGFQENELETEKPKVKYDNEGALPLDNFLTNGWFDSPLTIKEIDTILRSDFIKYIGASEKLVDILLFSTVCCPKEQEQIWSRTRDYVSPSKQLKASELQYFSSFKAANEFIKTQKSSFVGKPKSEEEQTSWKRTRDMTETSPRQVVKTVLHETIWNHVKSLSLLSKLAMARETAVSQIRVRELVQQSLAQAEISIIHEYFKFPESTSDIQTQAGEMVCLGREECKDWMRLRESIRETYVRLALEINGVGKFTDLVIESVKDIQGIGKEQTAEPSLETEWARPREKWTLNLMKSGVACIALLDIWSQTEDFKDTRGLEKQDSVKYEWSRPRESIIVALTKHEDSDIVSGSNLKVKPKGSVILSCAESGAYDIIEEECAVMKNSEDKVIRAGRSDHSLSATEPALEGKQKKMLCKPKETEFSEDKSSELETPDSRDNASLSETDELCAAKIQKVPKLDIEKSQYFVDENEVLEVVLTLDETLQNISLQLRHDTDLIAGESDHYKIEIEESEESSSTLIKLVIKECNEVNVGRFKCFAISEEAMVGLGFTVALNEEDKTVEIVETQDEDTKEEMKVPEEEDDEEEVEEEKDEQEKAPELQAQNEEEVNDDVKLDENAEDVIEEFREELKPTEDDETQESVQITAEEEPEEEKEQMEVEEQEADFDEAQDEDIIDDLEVKEEAEDVEEELKEEIQPTEDDENKEAMEAPQEEEEEKETEEPEEEKSELNMEVEEDKTVEDDLETDKKRQDVEAELQEEFKPIEHQEVKDSMEAEVEEATEDEEQKEAEQIEPSIEIEEDKTQEDELETEEKFEKLDEQEPEEGEEEDEEEEPEMSEDEQREEEPEKETPAEAEKEEEVEEDIVDEDALEPEQKKDLEEARAFGPLQRPELPEEPIKFLEEVAEEPEKPQEDDIASITSEDELENLMSNAIAESLSEHSLDEIKLMEPPMQVPVSEDQLHESQDLAAPKLIDTLEAPDVSQEPEDEVTKSEELIAIKIDIEEQEKPVRLSKLVTPREQKFIPVERCRSPTPLQEWVKVDLHIDNLEPEEPFSEEAVHIRVVETETPQKEMQSESVDLKILDFTEEQEETRVNINIEDRSFENQVEVIQTESIDLKILDLFDENSETFVNINVQDRPISDQVIVQVEQADAAEFKSQDLLALVIQREEEPRENREEPVHLQISTQSTEAVSSMEHVHLSIDTSSFVDIEKSSSLAKVSVFEENHKVFGHTDLVEVLAVPQESVHVGVNVEETSRIENKDTFARISITDAVSCLEQPDKPVSMAITASSTEAVSSVERVHLNIGTTNSLDVSKTPSLAKISVYEETGKLFTHEEMVEILASPHENVNVAISLEEATQVELKKSSIARIAVTDAITKNQSEDDSYEVLTVPQTEVSISIDQTLTQKIPERETFAKVTIFDKTSRNLTIDEDLTTLEVLSKAQLQENVNVAITTDDVLYTAKPPHRAIVSVSEPEFQEFFAGYNHEILATPKPTVNITFTTESISHKVEENNSEYNFLDIRHFKPERHQSKVSLNAQPLSRCSLVLVKTETETTEYFKDVSEKPKTNLSCVKIQVSEQQTTLLRQKIVKAQEWISEECGKTILNLPVEDDKETTRLENLDSFTGTVFPFVQGSAAQETQSWMQCLDQIQSPDSSPTRCSLPTEQKRHYIRDVLYNSVQENTSLLGSAIDRGIWTSVDGKIAQNKPLHGCCLSTRSALAFYSAIILKNIMQGRGRNELLDWHDAVLDVLESVRPGLQSAVEMLGSVVLRLNNDTNLDISEISSIVYDHIMELTSDPARDPRLGARTESPALSEESEHGIQDDVMENTAPFPPVFTSPPVGDIVVELGDDFTAELFVDCPPNRTSIQIKKDGERFYEPRNVHTDIIYASGIDIKMHFFSIENDNCGVYTLRAENTDGTDTSSFSLRIQPRTSGKGVALANKTSQGRAAVNHKGEGHIAPIRYEILDNQPDDEDDGFGFADDEDSSVIVESEEVSQSEEADIEKPKSETFVEYPKQILSAEVVNKNSLPLSCFSYVSEICTKSVQDVFSMINEVQNVVSRVESPVGMMTKTSVPEEEVTVEVKTEAISYEKHLSWENLLQEVVTERNPLYASHISQIRVNINDINKENAETGFSRSCEALGKQSEAPITEASNFNQCVPKVSGIAMLATKPKLSAIGQNTVISAAIPRCDSLIQDEIKSIVDKHFSTEQVSSSLRNRNNQFRQFRSATSSPVSESAPESKFVDWCEVPIKGFTKPMRTYSSGSSFSSTEKVHLLIKVSENSYLGGEIHFDDLGNICNASIRAPKYQSVIKAQKPILKGSFQWPSSSSFGDDDDEPMVEHKPATVFKVAPRKGFVKRRRLKKSSLDGSSWSLSSGDSYDLIPSKYLSNVSLNCFLKDYRQFEAPPAILTKYPSRVNVFKNNDVQLNVKIAASDDSAYMWYKNGKPVKYSSRLQVNIDEAASGTKNASLIIKNCVPEDEGTYLLRAVNNWGEERVQTKIAITQSGKYPEQQLQKSFISEIGIDLPDEEARKKMNTLVRVISNESLLEDDELIFPIRSADSFLPLKAEKLLNKLDNTKKNSWTSQSITALLDDYRNIPDAAPVFLSDLPEQNYLKSGNDVHISVKIASTPNTNLIWKKDGQELPADELDKFRVSQNLKWQNQYTSLVILNADKNDTGNYECLVETSSQNKQVNCLTTKITVDEDVSTCPERVLIGTQISNNEIVRRVRGSVKTVIESFGQSCKPLKSSLTTKAFDESSQSSMEDFIVYANVYETFECHSPKMSSVKCGPPRRKTSQLVIKSKSVLQASTYSLTEREDDVANEEQHSDLSELFCTELKTEIELTNESFGYSSTLDIAREEFYKLEDIASREKPEVDENTTEHRESLMYQSSVDIKSTVPQELPLFTARLGDNAVFDMGEVWSPDRFGGTEKMNVEIVDLNLVAPKTEVSDLSKAVFSNGELRAKSPEFSVLANVLDTEKETTKAELENVAEEKLPTSNVAVSYVQVLINPPSTETSPASSYDNLEDYDYGNVDEDLCKVAEQMQKHNSQKQNNMQQKQQNLSSSNMEYLEQSLETITEITEEESNSSKGSFDFEDSMTEAESEFDLILSEKSLDLRSEEVSDLNASSCESFDIEPESLFLKAVNNMHLMKAQQQQKSVMESLTVHPEETDYIDHDNCSLEKVDLLLSNADSQKPEDLATNVAEVAQTSTGIAENVAVNKETTEEIPESEEKEDVVFAKEDTELETAVNKPAFEAQQEQLLPEHHTLIGSLEEFDSFAEELDKMPESVTPHENEKFDELPEGSVTIQQAESIVCPESLPESISDFEILDEFSVAKSEAPMSSVPELETSNVDIDVQQASEIVADKLLEDEESPCEDIIEELLQTEMNARVQLTEAEKQEKAKTFQTEVRTDNQLIEKQTESQVEEIKPIKSEEPQPLIEERPDDGKPEESADVLQAEAQVLRGSLEEIDSIIEEFVPFESVETEVTTESITRESEKPIVPAKVAQTKTQELEENLQELDSLAEELETAETQAPVESQGSVDKVIEKVEVVQNVVKTDTVQEPDSNAEELKVVKPVEVLAPVTKGDQVSEKAEVLQTEVQVASELTHDVESDSERLDAVESAEAQAPVESITSTEKVLIEQVDVAQAETQAVIETLEKTDSDENLESVDFTGTEEYPVVESASAEDVTKAEQSISSSLFKTGSLDEVDAIGEEFTASSSFAPLLASADVLDAMETESVHTSIDHSGVNSKHSSLVGSPIEDLYLTPDDQTDYTVQTSELACAIQNLVDMESSMAMAEIDEDIAMTEEPEVSEQKPESASSEVVKSTLSSIVSGSVSVIETLTNLLEPSESELASVNALKTIDEKSVPTQQAEQLEIKRALNNGYVITPEVFKEKEPELVELIDDDFIGVESEKQLENANIVVPTLAEQVKKGKQPERSFEFVHDDASSNEKTSSLSSSSETESVEENENPIETEDVQSPVKSLARICMGDDFEEIDGSEDEPEKLVGEVHLKGKFSESSESEVSEDDFNEIDVTEDQRAFEEMPKEESLKKVSGVCKNDYLEDFLEIEESDISKENADDVACLRKAPVEGASSEEEIFEDDIKEFDVLENESAFLQPHLMIDSMASEAILESPEERIRKQQLGEGNLANCEGNEHFDFDELHSKRIASSSSQMIPQLACEKTFIDVISEKANEQQIRVSDWLASERGIITAAEKLAVALDVTPPESEVDSLSDLEKYLSKATHYSDAELVECDDKIEITTFEEIEICELEDRIKPPPQKSIIIIEEEVINYRSKKHKKPKIPVYKDSKKSRIGDKFTIQAQEQVSDEEVVSRVIVPLKEHESCPPAVTRKDPNSSDSLSFRTARDSLPSSSYRTAETTNRALSFYTPSEDVSDSLHDVPSIDRHGSLNSLTTFSEHESSVSSQQASEKSARPTDFDLQVLPLANMVEYHQKTTNRDDVPHKYLDPQMRVFTDLLTNREAMEVPIESSVCQFFTMTHERAAIKDHIRQLAEDEMFIIYYSSESGSSGKPSPIASPEPSRCNSPLNGYFQQTERKVVTIKSDSVDSLVVSPAMSEQCLDLIDKASSSESSSAASDPVLIRSIQRVQSRRMKPERAQTIAYKADSEKASDLSLGDLEQIGAITKDVVQRVRRIQPSKKPETAKFKHIKMTLSMDTKTTKQKSSSGESVTSVEKMTSFKVEIPPKMLSMIEDFEVNERGTAVLSISAMAEPAPKFQWMKGNVDVKPTSNGRINVKSSDYYSTLMITKFSKNDCGMYMCKIQNSAGICWQTIKISQINLGQFLYVFYLFLLKF